MSAYGSSDVRCTPSGYALRFDAHCFDTSGALVDARFDALIVKPLALPEPGHVALLSSGAALLSLLARRRGVRPR